MHFQAQNDPAQKYNRESSVSRCCCDVVRRCSLLEDEAISNISPRGRSNYNMRRAGSSGMLSGVDRGGGPPSRTTSSGGRGEGLRKRAVSFCETAPQIKLIRGRKNFGKKVYYSRTEASITFHGMTLHYDGTDKHAFVTVKNTLLEKPLYELATSGPLSEKIATHYIRPPTIKKGG